MSIRRLLNVSLVVLGGSYGLRGQAQNQSSDITIATNQTGTFRAGATTPEKVPDVPLLASSIRVLRGTYQPPSERNGRTVAPACVFSLSLGPTEESVQANAKSPLRVNTDGTCEADFEIGQPPKELIDWAAALRASPIPIDHDSECAEHVSTSRCDRRTYPTERSRRTRFPRAESGMCSPVLFL